MKSALIGVAVVALVGIAAYIGYDIATSSDGAVLGNRVGFAGKAIYESHQRQPEPKRQPPPQRKGTKKS